MSIIFRFICCFGLMLLDWVIVNLILFFIFHDIQLHLSPKWDVQNRFYPDACFVMLILCVAFLLSLSNCPDTPLSVSTYKGIQLSLVTLLFCRNLQFHISRFGPRWISSCPHSSMPIIQFFHLYVRDAFQLWVFEMLRLQLCTLFPFGLVKAFYALYF